MGSKFKGFPGINPKDVPFTQRLRFLQKNSERGKNFFEYDPEGRRRRFLVYKQTYLPCLSTQPCYVCRELSEVWHHIILICRGGWDCERNLVPLCKRCHKKAHRFNRFVRKPKLSVFVSPLVKPSVMVVFVPKE